MGMGWVGVERKRSRIVVRLTDQGLRAPYWFSWEPCWEMTIQVLEDVTPGFDARILLKGRNECNVEFAGRMGAEALWFSEGKAVSYKLRRWFRQGLNTDYIHRIVSLGWRLTRIEMERILSFPSPIGFKLTHYYRIYHMNPRLYKSFSLRYLHRKYPLSTWAVSFQDGQVMNDGCINSLSFSSLQIV